MTSSSSGSPGGGWWFRRPTWLLFVLVFVVGTAILIVGIVAVSVVVGEVVDDLEESQAARSTDTTVTSTTVLDGGANTLVVGECLDDDDLDAYLSGDDFSVKECDTSHDYEVYLVYEFPKGSYPGDDAVLENLQAECRRAFDGYVARDYESSALNIWSIWPGQVLWENGNRRGECLLFNTDGDTLTGTAYQSGW